MLGSSGAGSATKVSGVDVAVSSEMISGVELASPPSSVGGTISRSPIVAPPCEEPFESASTETPALAKSVSSSDREVLRNLERNLKLVIFGQDKAIEALVAAIKMARSGLGDQRKLWHSDLCQMLGHDAGHGMALRLLLQFPRDP